MTVINLQEYRKALKYFLSVEKYNSFLAAELCISQSSLSKHIKIRK